MDERFKIYLDRLRPGESEQLEESFSPEFLHVEEPDLVFKTPVKVSGEASHVDKTLVLSLSVSTEATMRCAICNEDVQVKIEIPKFTHTEDLTEIKSGIFDFSEVLRETLLLEVPHTVECHGGNCPERATLLKYFSKGDETHGSPT